LLLFGIFQASELYEVLIEQEKRAATTTSVDEGGWMSVWIDPVITLLCSASKKLKQHIIEVCAIE
jgi:hypothetical protein